MSHARTLLPSLALLLLACACGDSRESQDARALRTDFERFVRAEAVREHVPATLHLESMTRAVREGRITIERYVSLATKQAALLELAAGIDQRIDLFRIEHLRLPHGLEEMVGVPGEPPSRGNAAAWSVVPHDPWGREFTYRVSSRHAYELVSDGPDRVPDTPDDMRFPGQPIPTVLELATVVGGAEPSTGTGR